MFSPLSAFASPVVAFLFLFIVVGLSLRRTPMQGTRLRTVGIIALVLALGAASLEVRGVFLPGEPVAAGTYNAGETINLDAPGGPLHLTVRGHLPPIAGGAAIGRYAIDFAGGDVSTQVAGRFEERFQRQRVTRKTSGKVLVRHEENAHALPTLDAGTPIHLKVAELNGMDPPNVELEIVRAPDDAIPVLIVCVFALLVAALVDAREKTFYALGTAVLGAFALLLPVSAEHNSPFPTALAVGALAGFLGWLAAAIARIVGRALVGLDERAPGPGEGPEKEAQEDKGEQAAQAKDAEA